MRVWACALFTLTISAADPSSTPWSFRPLVRPKLPPGAVNHPIDAFVRARLQTRGLDLAKPAEAQTLLRRLAFDLTGLPAESHHISTNSPLPEALDRLFASPHYGERWARPWLDLARYADSDGYEKDWTRPWAWRYRQWVIDSLNANMPFDRFVIEQLAGDLVPAANTSQRIATGFQRMTLTNREGGIDNEQFRFENVLDRASTAATVFLGLTAGCAQCHNHKFDPISQHDFYRFAAFFDNVDEADIEAPLAGETGTALRGYADYRATRQKLLTEYNVQNLQSAWEANMLQAASEPGKRTDWDLAWDCLLKLTSGGDGQRIIRKPPAQRSQYEADVLADHFIRNYHFAVGQKTFQAAGLPQLWAKLEELKRRYPQPSMAYVVEENLNPRSSHLRVRGNYKALGPEVLPGTFATLPPLRHIGPRATRLDLARWIASRENPLTARVAVNRIWQEFFGQGLVRTSEDFGNQSERPVYPELLDWLAAEFIDSGWNVKHIQRLIVTSAVYQQSSNARPELKELDPQNTWLARQNRLRLPAELIRDNALYAAGLLSLKLGGPSVRPPQPPGVAELAYANSVKWTDSMGEDRYRRGIYTHFQRATPHPFLMNFDAPKGVVTACRRGRSNTSLQALNLLNDPVFVEAAQALAFKVLSTETHFDRQLDLAFQSTLARNPLPQERDRLAQYLRDQTAQFDKEPQAAAQLMPAPPVGVDRTKAAAWTALASVLMNTDEFITRE